MYQRLLISKSMKLHTFEKVPEVFNTVIDGENFIAKKDEKSH